MDTTSLSFYGEGGETLGAHGYSKDYRPDLKQMILGLVVDGAGRPICTEMWPGNTADVGTLLPVIDRLRRRFSIGRVCVVADCGMIAAATIEGLEARQLEYILGAREGTDAIVRQIVLANDDPFVPLLVERQAGQTQLFVKQVTIAGKRYVVCRNEEEAENDRAERAVIVAALDEQLKKGDKALIGNSAYRRYLRKVGDKDKRSFEIDAGKLAEEARFDGVFVLRTNAKVTPLQAVLRYPALSTYGRHKVCAISTSASAVITCATEPCCVWSNARRTGSPRSNSSPPAARISRSPATVRSGLLSSISSRGFSAFKSRDATSRILLEGIDAACCVWYRHMISPSLRLQRRDTWGLKSPQPDHRRQDLSLIPPRRRSASPSRTEPHGAKMR
jgi:hypothetical protein